MGLLDNSVTSEDYYSGSGIGSYQFTGLQTIVNQFMIAYVGEGKTISTVKKTDVAFHAQRAIQELSFDTLVSAKALEIIVPPSLSMPLPQDYVSYSRLSWSDSAGVEHIIYPVSVTSNPKSISQSNGEYNFGISSEELTFNDTSTTSDNYKANTTSSNADDYQDDTYWPINGSRFGLDPQAAQVNGSFYIDQIEGKIQFSSNISGKTIVLKYISDGVATDEEMVVHKFAEEAVYKWIAHAVVATRENTPEYLVARYKKERFAATRQAKLRLSKINISELTQVMRGKSKQIKH